MRQQRAITGGVVAVGNQSVPAFLVSDSVYQVICYVTRTYREKKTFSYRLCGGRVVVEIAFGHLKARWRRLLKQNEMHVDNVPHTAVACCTLHNICEIHGDTVYDKWLQDTREDLSPPEQRTAERN